MKEFIIGIDAMGGDNAPTEIVKGAVEYTKTSKKASIVLFGNKNQIEKELSKHSYNKDLINIKHTSEVILNEEVPTIAIKTKKDSSIVVALKALKHGEIDAFISAGSTGALLTGATIIVGRIKGIERPAIATLIPNEKGFTFLIDSGANVDCKASYLAQFAKIGSLYMKDIFEIENPRVGLLNIGVEKEKGNSLTKEAFELLDQIDSINFIGNTEARDITKGEVDVLVCDGFVGNVVLKMAEGVSKSVLNIMKKEIFSSFTAKIGALILAPTFKKLKKRFDYSEVGGAPFLGLKGLVVKAHGSSDSNAIKGAINQCVKFNELEIVNKIEEVL